MSHVKPKSNTRPAAVALRVTGRALRLTEGGIYLGTPWAIDGKLRTRRNATFQVMVDGQLQEYPAHVFEPVNPQRRHLFPHLAGTGFYETPEGLNHDVSEAA